MRINNISDKRVNVDLSADELVMIGNMMYYREHPEKQGNPSSSKPNDAFHELAAQIITARDLCQYGHLDSHSLSRILYHKTATARPNGRELPTALTDGEKETLRAYLEDEDIRTACRNDDFHAIILKIFGGDIPKGKLRHWMYPSEPE